MTHPNAIPTADLLVLIDHHTTEYERFLNKPDANWYDWTFQNHHFNRARELQAELVWRRVHCGAVESSRLEPVA